VTGLASVNQAKRGSPEAVLDPGLLQRECRLESVTAAPGGP
jgi:hypothetical protein